MANTVCRQAKCTYSLVHPDDVLCELHFRVLTGRIQDWIKTRLEKNNGKFYNAVGNVNS